MIGEPLSEYPDHPLLRNGSAFEIVGFCYERPAESEPFLDLTLRAEGLERRFRFWSPQEVRVEGFPSSRGVIIRDVRMRGLERLTVRFDDYEDTIGFWARTVEELQTTSGGAPA